MSDQIAQGDGWAVADALGDGYGFRKVRKQLDVTEFGVNLITLPPGFDTGRHMHERQPVRGVRNPSESEDASG